MAMTAAKRSAISTGHDHVMKFTSRGGTVASYQLMRRDGMSLTAIDSAHIFPRELSVTVSHAEMYFTFEGQAKAAYQIQLRGADRSFQLDVVPITGAITTTETTKL